MARFGFCNGTYQSISPVIDAEFTMNFYLEQPESSGARTSMALIGTPGLSLFTDLDGKVCRGGITLNSRAFEVVDGNLWEIFTTGGDSSLNRGSIANDNLPVSMAAASSNANQILIASAGIAYTYDLGSNTVTPVAALSGIEISEVAYLDGFYIALLRNSNKIMASSPLDSTTWPGASATVVSVYPDNVTGMQVMNEQLYLLGVRASIPYSDSGASPFPLAANTAAGVIQMGLGSQFSKVLLDNTTYFLGQDDRGGRMFWKFSGYTPVRVSTFAVEYALNSYTTVSDCIAYGYQEAGHSFAVFYFPTANATWVYDVASGQWHQRGQWDGVKFNAHPTCNHIYMYGKHLVGDPHSGKIYSMSLSNFSDNGDNIRRVRRSPAISNELTWITHNFVQVDVATGLGPQPPLLDGNGEPRGPLMWLSKSDDGGHTWDSLGAEECGQAGQFDARAIWFGLGTSRNRVYEISVDDPIQWVIADAYLEATGYQVPKGRMAEQLRQVS